MAKWAQGQYTPKNPEKYIGKHIPRYRSGWELRVMMFLDENKHILKWASEAIAIPYINPLTGKRANYIPDFFVMYENKHHKSVVIFKVAIYAFKTVVVRNKKIKVVVKIIQGVCLLLILIFFVCNLYWNL